MRLASLSVLVACVACTPDFENVTTIKDLRALAMPSDTPEVLLDSFAALPETLPTITMNAVAIDPAGAGRPVTFSAVACAITTSPNQQGRIIGPAAIQDSVDDDACPPASSIPVLPPTTVAPSGPQGIEAALAVPFSPTRELLVTRLAGDPIGAALGNVPITVQLTIAAGAEVAVMRKRAIFVQRLSPEQTANANPVVSALRVRTTREGPAAPLDEAAPPEVAADGSLFIDPEPAVAEPYVVREFDRNATTLPPLRTVSVPRETLRYAFFARYGTFSPAETSNEPPRFIAEPTMSIQSEYSAPATPPPGGVDTIWVVVRDERGGSSWTRGTIRVR